MSRSDFVAEVSEASKECWVVVLLYKDGVPDSKLLEQLFPQVRKGNEESERDRERKREREKSVCLSGKG